MKIFYRGEKRYELSNHLGNVLAVITDRRIQTCGAGEVMYYEAQVVTMSDYYPFGMQIQERTLTNTGAEYRFGFNGMEMDNESFSGCIAFEARIYDSRLGLFLSCDPYKTQAPQYSPYHYALNSPIFNVDVGGGYGEGYIDKDGKLHITINYSYVSEGIYSFNDVQIESLKCQFNSVYSDAVGMKVEINGRAYEIGSVTATFTPGGTEEKINSNQKQDNKINILLNGTDQKMNAMDPDDKKNLLGRTTSENGGSNNRTWIRGSAIESANIMADEAGHSIGMWHPSHGFTKSLTNTYRRQAKQRGYIGEAEIMAYVNMRFLMEENVNYAFGDLMLMKQQWDGEGGDQAPNLSLADMQMAVDGKNEKSLNIDMSQNAKKGKRYFNRKQ